MPKLLAALGRAFIDYPLIFVRPLPARVIFRRCLFWLALFLVINFLHIVIHDLLYLLFYVPRHLRSREEKKSLLTKELRDTAGTLSSSNSTQASTQGDSASAAAADDSQAVTPSASTWQPQPQQHQRKAASPPPASSEVEGRHVKSIWYWLIRALCVNFASNVVYICTTINVICSILMPVTWWWYIPYWTYCLLDPTPYQGTGRPWEAFRRSKYWDYVTSFFPSKIVSIRSKPSPPDKPFIFGYHPHGIFCAGYICAFGCHNAEVARFFPGTRIAPCTIDVLFQVPFLREYTLSQGFVSVSTKSVDRVLSKGPGHGVAIVVGGAREAGMTKEGCHDLNFRRRQGFFRKALIHGCRLVPVYCFGENDVYHITTTAEDSWASWISYTILRFFGFCLPLFHGRGILQRKVGLIPFDEPLTIVFGEPIDCDKVENPTTQQIEQLQRKYRANLLQLFEATKSQYAGTSDAVLRFHD